jgi:hypothetical protein
MEAFVFWNLWFYSFPYLDCPTSILQLLPQSWLKPDPPIPSPNLGFWYRVGTLPDVTCQFYPISITILPHQLQFNLRFLHLLILQQFPVDNFTYIACI